MLLISKKVKYGRKKLANYKTNQWLQENDMKFSSAHDEGKSVIVEILITIFNNKIYKYMTAISKTYLYYKLGDIDSEYHNPYHRTIKMKSVDVNSSTYTDISGENNDKTLNLKLVIM